MPEKNLLTNDDEYLIDAAGEYGVVSDGALLQPLVTPNTTLVSQASRVLAGSTGATVVARSSGQEAFSRGGTQPLVTPKSPLMVR